MLARWLGPNAGSKAVAFLLLLPLVVANVVCIVVGIAAYDDPMGMGPIPAIFFSVLLVVQLSLMNWARTQPWKAGLAFLLVWAGLGLVYAWSVYANMNADPSWQPAIWEIGLVLLPIPGALALLYTGWRERDQRQSAVRSA